MFEEFIIRAIIAGVIIAIVTGFLGCFVVWRRMAYFGDSLAHSALLGVAIGIGTNLNINLGIILICALFAVILVWVQHEEILATDTLLGIMAHAALSIGLVAVSFIDNRNVNLHSYLLSDIIIVSYFDIVMILCSAALVIVLLIFNWHKLLLITINEDIAKAEGVNTFRVNLLFMFLITIVVAIAIRIVGVLLITSMLIIPAAIARQLATTPLNMAFIASGVGGFAVICGVLCSQYFEAPSGPTIVTTAVILFLISMSIGIIRRKM